MITVNLNKPILTEYTKFSKNFISFRGKEREDSVEFNLDLDLDSLTNENGKPRFNKEEKAQIKKRVKPFNKKVAKMLLEKQDKNDAALSSLLYVEGGKYDYTHWKEEDIENSCIEGYNVKPRFNAEEICNILDTVNKTNIEFVEDLVEVENESVKDSIKSFFNEHKNDGFKSVSVAMQYRKALSSKEPDSELAFKKEIAKYDGGEIARILRSIDKYNAPYVKMLINMVRDKESDIPKGAIWIILDKLSRYRWNVNETGKMPLDTEKFVDYLLDLKFSGEEMSMLLLTHPNFLPSDNK